jgi:hypothetical protein
MGSMKIALAVPAYRQQVNVNTAYCWAQDAMSALELGWRPVLIWCDNSGIARARNVIVETALKNDCRLLLMCDSDTFADVQEGGLKHMWQVMQDTGAVAVGAAVVTRNGTRVNCEPSEPGEVYEGEVGTGYFLIDLWKLRDVPRPWFVHVDTADGLGVECGEDIYACRLFKRHGHKVVVNYALPTGHADQSSSRTFT